jgi:hypothetical protein
MEASMGYRAKVTDKQQGDIERAADQSANRFAWFDGKSIQTGTMKAVPALDLQGQGNTGGVTTSSKRMVPGSGSVVGSHNDNPARFETPGKA